MSDTTPSVWIAPRVHDEWERDLTAAFIHLVYGVGTPPAKPVDFSAHPIFSVLHTRWLAQCCRTAQAKAKAAEDQA